MFTGLTEKTGVLVQRGQGKLLIKASTAWNDLKYGESIAVNGCCLTLEGISAGSMVFHTLEESLRRTNLGSLPLGAKVNLERALRLGDRFGGHIVQGHVDTASEVLELKRLADGDMELLAALPEKDAPLVVEKGGIAIDGVSLTVVEAGKDFFGVRLIPVTLAETALIERKPGSRVNLEYDVIGRYILRRFELENSSKSSESSITMDTLREAGFL